MSTGHRSKSVARLVRHIVSSWRTQAIHAAVQLDFPDHLAAAPLTPEALASATGCDADGTGRLLLALCALGVCRRTREGRFALTRAGGMLCRNGDCGSASLRPLAEWWGGPLWPIWQNLSYSVRTGRSAREKLLGDKDYQYLERDGRLADVFHGAMRAMTALVEDDVAVWPGWKDVNTVVDLGGGHGQLLLTVLGAHSHLHGVVFDTETARRGAEEAIESRQLGSRARFEGGDFFASLPHGADCYVLKSILHNWNDERCASILGRCRRAVPRHARLLVVERLRAEAPGAGAHDQGVARTDLNMLAGLGGRERSAEEYSALLDAAGFGIVDIHRTTFEFSLVEARALPTRSGPARRR